MLLYVRYHFCSLGNLISLKLFLTIIKLILLSVFQLANLVAAEVDAT
jgi:hypothetical protein